MSFRRSALLAGLCSVTVAVSVLLPISAAAAPAADPPQISGQVCAVGEGVTFVVDFTPARNEIKRGCAEGDQPTVAAAGKAAGFDFDAPAGFVCAIDTVVAEPTTCTTWPGAYWSLFTSTTDGKPDGPPATAWQSAVVGIDAGPAPAGTALLFQIQPYDAEGVARTPLLPLSQIPTRAGDLPVNPPSYPPSRNGDALAAAGWLGRQLAANGDRFTDWGVTEDAVLALAAAGVGGNQIAATAGKVFHSGNAYIGDPADTVASWSRIAKTALVLQVAGLDPTAFPDGAGQRNLIAELRATQNADGSFGAAGTDFPLVHALALLVLARTSAGFPASTVSWLEGRQCTVAGDANVGAYGYGATGCDGVDVDGTALAVQALDAAGLEHGAPAIADARTWLIGQQDASGGMPAGFGGGLNSNSTALAGQAFLGLGDAAPAASAAGFVGSLQVSCTIIAGHDALDPDTAGAIAYDSAGLAEAQEFGIDDTNGDQWTRATSQAILGLGTPTFGEISAAGATPALPAAPACAPTTTPPTTPTSTAASSAPSSSASSSRPASSASTSRSSTSSAASTPGTSSTPATTARSTASSAHPAGARLVLSPPQVAPGGHLQVTITGVDGPLTGTVELRSDPVLLGNIVTDADGTGSTTVTIPLDTPVGTHHIVVAIGGVEVSAELVVRVELAATGVSQTTKPLTLLGLLLLLVGCGTVLLARRPRIRLGRHRL